ncbi:MAG: hypothetical protein M0R06_21830 [Sphaerochaeta sp.]|jgi:hypothetical protein|nr:hypothetical protein [Sphaerochaeta sp.]
MNDRRSILRAPRLTPEERARLATPEESVRLRLRVVAGPASTKTMVETVPIRNLHLLGLTEDEARARAVKT